MTRTVFRGGLVFDGTGADPLPADVTVEDGRIVDVGRGLDGDEAVDLAGRTLLPGLFDCHVHVVFSHVDAWRQANTPFSYSFYEAARNLDVTLRTGITSVRDAGGADLGIKQARLGRAHPGAADADQPGDAQSDGRPRRRLAGLRGPSAAHLRAPGGALRDRGRPGRDAPEGPGSCTGWAPT